MKRHAVPGKAWDDMSLMERMEDTQYVTFFPALTLMVFIRDKPGYRTMHGPTLFVLAGILGILAQFFPGTLLGYYAAAMLALGNWRRHQGWQALNDGERAHTRSFGESYLARLPYWPQLPLLFAQNRFQRLWEPLAFFVFGWLIVMRFDWALGAWIAFSAMCLSMVEQVQYQNAMTHTFNTLDGIVESGVQESNVRHFSDDGPSLLNVASAPRANMTGTATGVSDDIAAQVARRKQYDAELLAQRNNGQSGMDRAETV